MKTFEEREMIYDPLAPDYKKTEQELRENIAGIVDWSRCNVCDNCGTAISTDNPKNIAIIILATIKEAGWKSPEMLRDEGYFQAVPVIRRSPRMRSLIKKLFRLYDLNELQAGGWCGCCGKWLPDVILPKGYPYTICPDWETSPRHNRSCPIFKLNE